MSDFRIDTLGDANFPNPVLSSPEQKFTDDKRRLLLDPHVINGVVKELDVSVEVGGPRSKIYFEPAKTTAVIVTCGGLCPGLNGVVRALTLQMWHRYGVRRILGIKFGYQGFSDEHDQNVVRLFPDIVENVHEQGGTILGTSRGTPGVKVIVDRLMELKADILFAIGGDGTMRGGRAINEEIKKRGLKIAVIGIPKTIDNDIPYVRQSFGFESAVEVACQSVIAAHQEARGARNGIGLVKLMGRHSGYIAANVALATGHVNYCLVPEVPFSLTGEHGLLHLLEKRLTVAGHAVIAIAEGAGQYFFQGEPQERDKSGNAKLKDVGPFLSRMISEHFRDKNWDFTLKYIDPSYLIRATPANPADRLFCAKLGRNAVHAAMAGKTGMLVGYWHGRVTHIPFEALEGQSQTINPNGELWFNVLESTGQPYHIGDPEKLHKLMTSQA